jgi:hypothetical protein
MLHTRSHTRISGGVSLDVRHVPRTFCLSANRKSLHAARLTYTDCSVGRIDMYLTKHLHV